MSYKNNVNNPLVSNLPSELYGFGLTLQVLLCKGFVKNRAILSLITGVWFDVGQGLARYLGVQSKLD
jgi:hypothetical protein